MFIYLCSVYKASGFYLAEADDDAVPFVWGVRTTLNQK